MKKTKLTRSLMAAVSIVALSAVMYGCVHSGDDPVPADPPDLSEQIGGASAAAMAAATAASAAATAVAEVAGDSTADPASYVEARDAAAAAMAASNAAAAASADAAAATTLEDAEAAQAAAEAAQADAEAALANAQMYAGMVTAAQTALDEAEAARIAAEEEAARIAAEEEAARIAAEEEAARLAAEEAARIAAEEEAARIAAEEEAARIAAEEAAAELAALAAARTTADAAADAAEMSASDAAAAVAAAADGADADMASYASAQAAATAAMTAATAAREASDAAARATTSADAATHQATAEEQRGAAATALGNAMSYAGMVTTAKMAADEAAAAAAAAAAEAAALTAAQDAAAAAVEAAKMAADAASATVMGVSGSQNLNTITAAAYARAQDAATDAATAHIDAVGHNALALAAMTSADAAEHQAAAEAAQRMAELASMSASSFARIVSDQQMAADDHADNQTRLTAAREGADTAAKAARMSAEDAQTAADAVAELLGADSQAAMDAQDAADAADAAADEAEAASMRADDDTDAGEAEMEEITAVGEQGKAAGQLLVAQDLRSDAQSAVDAAGKLQEERDLADAKADAKMYAEAAATHYGLAKDAATAARADANAAKASANQAKYGRKGEEAANTAAMAAEAAAVKAEAARDAAKTANDAAQAAYMAAMGATTSTDAQAERDKAKENKMTAAMRDEDAVMYAGTAMTQADAAATAAATPGLGVFTSANHGLTVPGITTRRNTVGTLLETSAAALLGNQDGDTTASANWPADVPDDPNTRDRDESMTGMLTITVDPDGTAAIEEVVSDTVGDADNDPIIRPNATMIRGVGDFMHGFDIIERGTSALSIGTQNGSTRVVAFTDKEQNTPAKAAHTRLVAETAVASRIVEVGTRDATTGNHTGVSYDHDNNPDTAPITLGTLTCTVAATCTIDAVNNPAGTDDVVSSVSGYRFSGTLDVAAVPEMNNLDYLLFGIWLDTATTTTFGAFATGGDPYETNSVVEALEGTATYAGKAVGAHHITGSAVSYFEGDANLTADFDADDGDANTTEVGSIEGSISGIRVDGGAAMSQSINLVKTYFNASEITFNGAAVMGAQSGAGQATHAFNGTWSGGFYGDNADDATEHPDSVAGTFGVTRTDRMDNTDPLDDVTESFVGAFGAHNTKD